MVESAGLAVVVTLLTLLCRDGVPAVLKLLKGRHEIHKDDAADERTARREQTADDRKQDGVTVKELKELIGVLRADGLEYRDQLQKIRDAMSTVVLRSALCEAQRARAEERITALEEALDRAGVKYRRYNPDGLGSGTHRSFPSGSDGKGNNPNLPPQEEPANE